MSKKNAGLMLWLGVAVVVVLLDQITKLLAIRYLEGQDPIELLGGPLPVIDGTIDLGDRPGLGIELDDAAVDDMRLADPSAVPDGNYCDVVYGRGQTRYIGDYVGRAAS